MKKIILILCIAAIGCSQKQTVTGKDGKAYQVVPARDYQIEFVEDSMLIFDGHRYVGTIPMWDNSPLDSLLQKDNE